MQRLPVTFALVAIACTEAHSAQPRRGSAHRAAPKPPPLAVDPGVVADPQQPDLAQGTKGSSVVRAQVLLSRAHFSCGELDADFGLNLYRTVRAFQGERNLPVTGVVDAPTWAALNADTAPVITTYTSTPADVEGPFNPVPSDMKAQAALPALGYTSPLEELSERFHASPALMRALNPNADFRQAGQQLNVPNVLTMPPGPAARIVVSRGEGSVRAYDGAGKLLAFYVATTGSEHDPLPIGEFTIRGVAHNPKFHYNAKLFWDAKDPNDRAVIQPGPNNPVGVVWIDLSKEHYGIHGTPAPGNVGHSYSHGCIRLTNWDAAELAAIVKPNLPATLQE
jgi:lipoprotein-anchoring transpeptidase ErfK/SrfK